MTMLVPYILKVKKNGRAPASHAGSTGIDTQILPTFLYQHVIGYSFFTTSKLDFPCSVLHHTEFDFL